MDGVVVTRTDGGVAVYLVSRFSHSTKRKNANINTKNLQLNTPRALTRASDQRRAAAS